MGTYSSKEAPENMSNQHPLIPIQKISNNIDNPRFTSRTKVVLLGCGSFSPIHLMHVEMFEKVKEYLEKEEEMEVVGGWITASHDEYVSRKLGEEWVPIAHRFKMIELALQESSWISLSQWEGTRERFSYFDVLLSIHAGHLKQCFPGHKIQLMFICGADLAANNGGLAYGVGEFPVVIVGRKNYTQYYQERVRTGRYEKGKFIFIEEELKDMSSTEIRKRVKEKGNLEEMMHPAAAAYYSDLILSAHNNESDAKEKEET